jgi:transcriptional regulator with XRE-family HTH domain
MSKSKSSIGENIRKYRLQKNMSQDRLSKLADVAFHTIVKIESGETPNPTIETVRKIAVALGVRIDDLMQ